MIVSRLIWIVLIFATGFVRAQVVSTFPTFPRADEPVIITVDVSGTSLDDFPWNNTSNPVWLWTWIEDGNNDSDAPTNVDPATSPAQDAAKCFRISTNPDLYQITITPTEFFNKPASEIPQIGLKLKSRNWSDGKQTDNDRFITFFDGFDVTFTKPTSTSIYVDVSDEIDIELSASEDADLSIKVNDVVMASTSSPGLTLNYTHTVTESPGSFITVTGEGDNSEEVKSTSFTYYVRVPTEEDSRPAGIIDGINYHEDETMVTLSLWAPDKSSVYVLGDFNNWMIQPEYLMKRDGEHFWLTIADLTAGQEYAFQYLVDETVYMADPYADKILDPDDVYIPASTYPDLKTYPAAALRQEWYFNRVAVFQTGQTPFEWQIQNFEKPAKEKLVVYELLIRDFFGADDRTYKNLTDTISYLKRLGVNAVELMPIMEFNGNESWGYNPAFMFAPDKYYGTKNDFKTFVDKCHQEGIAVILDIAMNHHDVPNPYVMMDFDFNTFKPTADNKWFNVSAKHPFNVFFDMNHESTYTQAYLDTVNYHWLHEYKIDGFRFDLSKGFTQTNHPDDVGAWSSYDASRIALIKRMADAIWAHTPDAYVILEHFADNAEEKELVEYKADEGKGMMVWGNLNHAYNQNTMGFASGSDVAWIYHGTRNWSVPHVIGYMESHDEERLMYKNLAFGNSSGSYNVKSPATALNRIKAANVLFYTIPGPKMLWQFGELGYDESINRCEDGSINDGCRLSPKPLPWDDLDNAERESLFEHTRDIIQLRNTYDVFHSGTATILGGNTLVKQITLTNNPYVASPTVAEDMNVQIVVNFELTQKNVLVSFPHTGTWYDYYNQASPLQVNSISETISMKPGEYKIFTDYPVESSLEPDPITAVSPEIHNRLRMYPNPAYDAIQVDLEGESIRTLAVRSIQGVRVVPQRIDEERWDIAALAPGLYIVEIQSTQQQYKLKLIKR